MAMGWRPTSWGRSLDPDDEGIVSRSARSDDLNGFTENGDNGSVLHRIY
jgi:hypothetical protein